MADVARGLWKPPMIVEALVEVEIPTFHAFSEEWWRLNEKRFAAKTRTDYRWRLEAPPAAVLRGAALGRDHVRHGGALHRREARRGQAALAPVDQHDVILLGAILRARWSGS